MKLLLLVSLAALVGVAIGCSGVDEGAIQLAGLGYANGKYYRVLGGIAGSEKKQKLVGFFNVSSDHFTGFSYVHFDFEKEQAFAAYGTSKDDAVCKQISLDHARHFRLLVPKLWPNSRVIHRSTVTSQKVPVSVYCGGMRAEKTSVHISGVFDDACVPLVIKKRYQSHGQNYGGAVIFGGFHQPRDKYFQLPEICAKADGKPESRRQVFREIKDKKGIINVLN